MNITSAGSGKAVAELLIEKEHTNRAGYLHGGFAATLVDSITTLAMMSDAEAVDGLIPGVSVDLNVQFMSPAVMGSTIVLQAETLRRGKSIAFLTVDIIDKSSRRLLARGNHVKYIVAPKL